MDRTVAAPSFFMKRLSMLLACFLLTSQLTAQFQLNGSATSIGNDCYRLTQNQTNQTGRVWSNTVIDLNQPFDIYAEIFLGANDGGGDGLAFGLQQFGPSAGLGSGGMGYAGITPSFVVEFDTQSDVISSDPTTDHISFMRNGTNDHASLGNLVGPADMVAGGANTEDNQYHEVRFTWDPATTTFRTYFDCDLRLTYTGNIIVDIFANNPAVYWGFTGSTGQFTNEQSICLKYVSFTQALRDTSICKGDSVQLAIINGQNYQWSPSAGLSNDTIANPKASPDTTTTYNVTVTDSCGSTRMETMIIQVDSCPPVVTVQRFNCYEVLYTVIPGTGANPISYSWSGSGGLTGNTDTARIDYGGPGTYVYTITVVDVNTSLSFTLTDSITLQSIAVANAGMDRSVCSRQVAVLGQVALPNLSYSWKGLPLNFGLPAGTGTQQAQVPIIYSNTSSSPQTFCYELTAVDTGFCVAIDTACVTIAPEPPNDFSMTDTVCQGDYASMVYAGTAIPGLLYNWNFGSGRDAAGNSGSNQSGPLQVRWQAPFSGLQTVTLTTTLNGCTSRGNAQTIYVQDPPSADFNVISPICQGQATAINYFGSGGTNAIGNWDFNGGTLTSGTNLDPLTVTWSTPGQKVISLFVEENGCIGTIRTDTVVVYAIPVAAMNNPGSVCEGDSVQFVSTGTASATAFYSWNFSGGGAYPSNPGPGPVRVAWVGGGVKTVTLTIQDNGCFSNLASENVTVFNNPVATILPVANQCFTGNSFDFIGPAGTYTYTWNFGTANPPGSALQNPTGVSYSTTGLKAATLRIAENGCISDPETVFFEVVPEPRAAFIFNSPGGTVCSADTVTFSLVGAPIGPAQTYIWNFGTDAIPANSSLPSPGPVFYTSGGFKIIRLTTNYRGCVHDTVFSFRVEESPILSAGLDKEFCEGDGGVQLDATTTGGLLPYTYSWSCDVGGCGISSTIAEDPFVNPLAIAPDTIRYAVQVTDARGCKSNVDWANVVVHPKPKVNAGPNDTLCAQGPGIVLQGGLAIDNKAPGPFSWQWTDSAGNAPPPGILPPNDKQPIAYTRPNKTTIYVLLAVDVSTGCSSQPTTVNPLSTAVVLVRDSIFSQAGRDTLICFGDTIRLNGFGFGGAGPYDYGWTPTGTGYFDDPAKPDPRISPQQTTTYTLVIGTNECFSPGDQITVSVENIPTVEAGNNLAICQGDTIRLIGQASGSPLPAAAAYTYRWSPALGLNDPFIKNPIAYPQTTTQYTLTAISNQGCGSASDNMLLTVKSTPIANVLTPDTLICVGDEFNLRANHSFSQTANAAPVVYLWSPQSAIIGSTFGTTVKANPDVSTTYTVRTTYAGCSTSDVVNISVSPQPLAQIVVSDSVICSGELVNLQANGGFGNSTYSWSPADGLSDVVTENPIANPDTSIRYYLTIKEGACSSSDSMDILVYPQPEAEFLHSQPEGCVGLSVSFLATSEDAIAYVWDFGDGSPLNNEPNPIHQYNDVGEFPVILTVIGAGGCESTASLITVKVGESIFADFDSEPVPGSQLTLPDALIIFLDQSRSASNWLWDFGDGESSTDINPVHSYYETGEFDVTLTVTDSNGCVSSITYGPYVIFEPDLFIPNVFSPNGDNINDRFEIVYTGVENFHLEVFDRWGRAFFASDSPENLWNGTNSDGSEATVGVYYYALSVGNKIIRGNVTLLR